MKCLKCDWQGSVEETDWWKGPICPKCGCEVIMQDELTAPPLIETQVDMAAVERCERMVGA